MNYYKNKISASQILLILFICAAPFFVLGGIFRSTGTQFSDFHIINSDEIDYWAESVSLARNGLFSQSGGYFGYSLDKHAKLLNFGAHAPFNLIPFAIAYSICNSQYMALFTNAMLISISLLGFFFITKSSKKTFFTLILLFTFLPFSLYFFTGMIETLIYAGVILIAAFYEKLFKEPENIAKSLRLYILLVIVWSFFRLTMLCFLFPALLVEITTKKKNILWVICKYALLILGTTVFLWFLSASFPWSFIGQWLRSSQKINFFLRHGFSSAFRFLLPTIGDPLEVALRYLYLAWSLTLLIKFLKSVKTEGNGKFYLLGHLLVLTSHLIFVFFFYDFDELRGFRMLAPILAFSLFASLMNHPSPLSKKISFGASFFVWMVFIILAIPQRDSLFKETVLRRLEPIHKSEIFQSVKYTENAHDRWENTVYVDLFIYPDMNYAHFTPGLGMMVFRVDELEGILTESPPDILKAKYLISSSDIFFPGYKKMASDMDISLYQKIKD